MQVYQIIICYATIIHSFHNSRELHQLFGYVGSRCKNMRHFITDDAALLLYFREIESTEQRWHTWMSVHHHSWPTLMCPYGMTWQAGGPPGLVRRSLKERCSVSHWRCGKWQPPCQRRHHRRPPSPPCTAWPGQTGNPPLGARRGWRWVARVPPSKSAWTLRAQRNVFRALLWRPPTGPPARWLRNLGSPVGDSVFPIRLHVVFGPAWWCTLPHVPLASLAVGGVRKDHSVELSLRSMYIVQII